ncbi:MAG: hypothetical protein K9G48_08645 [Reyranella sp.]|nr:hypothetical protein [Reyranella sp.]
MNPQEFFWQLVGDLGTTPWNFKAGCAVAILFVVYSLPRHWEHLPLMLGLALIAASPWLPPAGPFGDWLVYPSAFVVLLRCRIEKAPRIAAERKRQGPDPAIVVFNALRPNGGRTRD